LLLLRLALVGCLAVFFFFIYRNFAFAFSLLNPDGSAGTAGAAGGEDPAHGLLHIL
jgi:hypothetical protein